ncbi:cuticle protein AM1199-like [Cherax quadricarinatus]|uniref:cuticle protein AM1199-like n=1 Tax=Cherax quadricarinatus TaxID=27406 RepID=UPI002379502B|nr:cuticle protein AM1199-like [Cherax quadricarinatus]
MKLIVVACLVVAAAVAAPQSGRLRDPRFIAIVRDNRQDTLDGNYKFEYEGDNGIYVDGSGRQGVSGGSNMAGYYRFPLPEGGVAEVRYTADENGFRVQSPLIPTPHPLPAHAIEQIRNAEEQRRRGIIWD